MGCKKLTYKEENLNPLQIVWALGNDVPNCTKGNSFESFFGGVKSDHLGNVRATILRSPDASNNVQVESYADYYGFGMKMPGQSLDPNSYGRDYQGIIKDQETGYNAFDLRMFDGRIGRWLSFDPKNQHFSPYLAMSNNPVSFIDPDGGEDGPAYEIDGLRVSAAVLRGYMYSGETFDIEGAGMGGNFSYSNLQYDKSKAGFAQGNTYEKGTYVDNNGKGDVYWKNPHTGQIETGGQAAEFAKYVSSGQMESNINNAFRAGLTGQSKEWLDGFKNTKAGATGVRGLTAVAKFIEAERVRQGIVNSMLAGKAVSTVPNALTKMAAVSKTAGVAGIVASWGIAGYQYSNGTDNTSTWVNAGTNTVILAAAILGGPITVGVAAGAGIVYGASYLIYGKEMDAAIDNNFGYR